MLGNRPGDTFTKIVNGYIVEFKNHDDRCSGMHGSYNCSCGADSYNEKARKEAEAKPIKNPPDTLQPICAGPTTTYQLTQKMWEANTILGNLRIHHQPHCTYRENNKFDTCICKAKQVLEKIRAARELLSLK